MSVLETCGSFSKNFGWNAEGAGFDKLRTCIRSGFGEAKLVPTIRWSATCGLQTRGIDLIPRSFFLREITSPKGGHLVSDPLVERSMDHTALEDFTRLAISVFHMACSGRESGGFHSRWGRWANGFVREHVWQDGRWAVENFQDYRLEHYIRTNVAAENSTHRKMVTNYLYMMREAGYLDPLFAHDSPLFARWRLDALETYWTRQSISRLSALSKTELIQAARQDQLDRVIACRSEELEALVELATSTGAQARVCERVSHVLQLLRR